MTQKTVVEAKVVKQAVPVAIHTKWATVAVFGHELVSKRDLVLLHKCLTMPEWEDNDHGVRVVTFREDNYPVDEKTGKPVMANAAYDCGGLTINLVDHWKRAFRCAIDEEQRSVYACYNQMLIQSYFHEMAHMAPRVDAADRKQMDQEPDPKEEESAENFSLDMLFAMAKTTDIEPGLWQDSTFFAECFNDMMVDAHTAAEAEDPWHKMQMWMLDNRVFYHLPAADAGEDGGRHPVTRNSFKGYVQLMDKKGGHQPDWDQETILDHVAGSPGAVMEQMVAPLAAQQLETQTQHVPMSKMADPNTAICLGTGADTVTSPPMPDPAAPSTEPTLIDDEEWADYGEWEEGGGETYVEQEQAQPMTNYQAADPNQGMQQQPVYRDATGPSEYVPPQNTQLPVIYGMTADRTAQIIKTVYMKVFQHIFSVCQPTWQHGPERPFLWPDGALHQAIALTQEEQAVCFSMDCMDTAGRVCMDVPTTRGLVGRLDSQKALPMYDLTFNFMGRRIRRRCAPQNPGKLKVWRQPASGYTGAALRAQQGALIMHIFENDPTVKQANKQSGKGDWVNKIEAANTQSRPEFNS